MSSIMDLLVGLGAGGGQPAAAGGFRSRPPSGGGGAAPAPNDIGAFLSADTGGSQAWGTAEDWRNVPDLRHQFLLPNQPIPIQDPTRYPELFSGRRPGAIYSGAHPLRPVGPMDERDIPPGWSEEMKEWGRGMGGPIPPEKAPFAGYSPPGSGMSPQEYSNLSPKEQLTVSELSKSGRASDKRKLEDLVADRRGREDRAASYHALSPDEKLAYDEQYRLEWARRRQAKTGRDPLAPAPEDPRMKAIRLRKMRERKASRDAVREERRKIITDRAMAKAEGRKGLIPSWQVEALRKSSPEWAKADAARLDREVEREKLDVAQQQARVNQAAETNKDLRNQVSSLRSQQSTARTKGDHAEVKRIQGEIDRIQGQIDDNSGIINRGGKPKGVTPPSAPPAQGGGKPANYGALAAIPYTAGRVDSRFHPRSLRPPGVSKQQWDSLKISSTFGGDHNEMIRLWYEAQKKDPSITDQFILRVAKDYADRSATIRSIDSRGLYPDFWTQQGGGGPAPQTPPVWGGHSGGTM